MRINPDYLVESINRLMYFISAGSFRDDVEYAFLFCCPKALNSNMSAKTVLLMEILLVIVGERE